MMKIFLITMPALFILLTILTTTRGEATLNAGEIRKLCEQKDNLASLNKIKGRLLWLLTYHSQVMLGGFIDPDEKNPNAYLKYIEAYFNFFGLKMQINPNGEHYVILPIICETCFNGGPLVTTGPVDFDLEPKSKNERNVHYPLFVKVEFDKQQNKDIYYAWQAPTSEAIPDESIPSDYQWLASCPINPDSNNNPIIFPIPPELPLPIIEPPGPVFVFPPQPIVRPY